MEVRLTDDAVEIELTSLEQAASLHGDIVLPYAAIESAEVDPDPIRRIGIRWTAVGLHVPRIRYLCTTGWGRDSGRSGGGKPALRLAVRHGRLAVRHGRLREVTIGLPEAAPLVEQNLRAHESARVDLGMLGGPWRRPTSMNG